MENKTGISKENGSYRKRRETGKLCYNLGDLGINIQIHNTKNDHKEMGCDDVD
jgi:hypothetical protein